MEAEFRYKLFLAHVIGHRENCHLSKHAGCSIRMSATNRSQLSDEFRNLKLAALRSALEREEKWFQHDARDAWVITSVTFDGPLLARGSGDNYSPLRNLPDGIESNSLANVLQRIFPMRVGELLPPHRLLQWPETRAGWSFPLRQVSQPCISAHLLADDQ